MSFPLSISVGFNIPARRQQGKRACSIPITAPIRLAASVHGEIPEFP
jgi:hypothetical protein